MAQVWAPEESASLPLSAIAVPNVYLGGISELGRFSISMFEGDLIGGLRLNNKGKPFLAEKSNPNFWLEGRMTIKLQPTGTEEIISLVSRKPVLQTGRVKAWPPYNTVMHDVSGPNEYVPIDAQDGPPFMLLWSGSITIGNEPHDFLSTDIPIRSFEYVRGGEPDRVRGVKLAWDDMRAQIPSIYYYQVYKRELGTGIATTGWERVGGNIEANNIVDESFDGSKAMTYWVRQVFVDHLGDEFIGLGSLSPFTVPALPRNVEQLRVAGFR